MTLVESDVSHVDGLPLRVFLQVVEAIALNEDVKYTSRAGGLTTAGRVNTMLTFAHLCGVFTGRADLGSFAGAFARPPLGLSPLSQKDVRLLFPLLEPDSLRSKTFEQVVEPIRCALDPLVGQTASQLLALTAGTPVSPDNRGRLRIAIDRILVDRAPKTARERFSKGALLRVVRADLELSPAEDVSFAPFVIERLLLDPWPKSSFRAVIHAPMLFVVFSETPKGDERLEGLYPAMIPIEEIETSAHAAWKQAIDALQSARRDLLPMSSQGPFFVRNHAGKKRVNEAGDTVTPLSFWISRRYVRHLLVTGVE